MRMDKDGNARAQYTLLSRQKLFEPDLSCCNFTFDLDYGLLPTASFVHAVNHSLPVCFACFAYYRKDGTGNAYAITLLLHQYYYARTTLFIWLQIELVSLVPLSLVVTCGIPPNIQVF